MGHGSSDRLVPLARAAEVGTTPIPVGAGGRSFVVVRLHPGGDVSAFPARCPHRLVPLATATVVDGRLRCPAHGWRFDGGGRCAEIPSLGPDGTPPPRADLPVPWAVEERHGWVWIAPDRTTASAPPRHPGAPATEDVPAPPPPTGPVFTNLAEPVDHPLEVPEAGDRHVVDGWLPPLRSPGPAGPLADTFLDATHGPFVHAETLAAVPVMQPYDVVREPGGFSSVQPQEVHDPADPRQGTRKHPRRRPRRSTYTYRAPFQLRLRQEFPDSGATTTIVYLLQPEDLDSTRIYVCLLLADGPGRPLPAPATLVAQVALQKQVLAEDIRSQEELRLPGLPLDRRAEVHVPADTRGVALRQALCDFMVVGRRQPAA